MSHNVGGPGAGEADIDPKKLLSSFFKGALRRVDVKSAVQKHIVRSGNLIRIGVATYDNEAFDRVLIIAVGKAATPMYEGALEALRMCRIATASISAVVVAPVSPAPSVEMVFCKGAHPTPDAGSRHAADIVCNRIGKADGRTLILFLISGGASSMIEKPLDMSISIADTADFYRALVNSGLPIADINVLRKYFSSVKGGRLVSLGQRAAGTCTLIVSDVTDDSLGVVGSGPTVADLATKEDCLRIFGSLKARVRLPESVVTFFEGALLIDTPKPKDVEFAKSDATSILSSEDLSSAVANIACEAGFHVEVDNDCDEQSFQDAGSYLLARGRELRQKYARCCLISVGEISVEVTSPSGSGGRNQHFALWCATAMAEAGDSFWILSAGSDGIDGHSPAAGAIVDGSTCARARQLGLDVDAALIGFNSYPLLLTLGDTLVTGPTGNNLRDLRIVLSIR